LAGARNRRPDLLEREVLQRAELPADNRLHRSALFRR
jgi:hypothetical protein